MKVTIIGAALSAAYLRIIAESVEFELDEVIRDNETMPQKLSIERLAPKLELDFYPEIRGKQKAQWKRETRGKRLK